MVFGEVIQGIKISIFSNCESHKCIYNPSKLPKKENLFQRVIIVVMLAIKFSFFGNCGSIIAYVSHQNFLKQKYLLWKVTANSILSSFLFWIVGSHVFFRNFLFRNFLFWKVTTSLILSSFLFGNIT